MAFYRVSPIGTTKTWLGFTGLVLCALLLPAVLYLTIPDNDGETIPVTLGLESADWAIPVTDQHDTKLECPGTVSLLEQSGTWTCGVNRIAVTSKIIESGREPERTFRRAIRGHLQEIMDIDYQIKELGNIRYSQMERLSRQGQDESQTVLILTGTGDKDGKSLLVTVTGAPIQRQSLAELLMTNLVREDRHLQGDNVDYAAAARIVADSGAAEIAAGNPDADGGSGGGAGSGGDAGEGDSSGDGGGGDMLQPLIKPMQGEQELGF